MANSPSFLQANANKDSKPNYSKWVVYLMILLMITTGSINTIANKLQNLSTSLDRRYQHNWFITFCMFLGECLCLIAYYIMLYVEKNKKTQDEELLVNHKNIDKSARTENTDSDSQVNQTALKEPSPFSLMLPALCDFFGSSIMTIGLGLIASSVYQMLRGSLIIFTTIFSIIFLKSKFHRHNYLGITVVVSGLTLVGIASLGGSSDDSNNAVVGFTLVIFAQLFTATQFIIEENFMKKYTCHPLKAVGWEGIWGTCFYLVFLVVAQNIKCPVGDSPNDFFKLICFQSKDNGVYLLEDTLFALRQLGNNSSLLFYCILYIFSIGLFNFVGISISKILSSPARAVIDTIRTIVVWGFFLLPIVEEEDREHFKWLQFIGFILLILGTVIYNEILVIPIFGFDKYIKDSNGKYRHEKKDVSSPEI
jgi:drug/metabolite transporter (DMT)-like permease